MTSLHCALKHNKLKSYSYYQTVLHIQVFNRELNDKFIINLPDMKTVNLFGITISREVDCRLKLISIMPNFNTGLDDKEALCASLMP